MRFISILFSMAVAVQPVLAQSLTPDTVFAPIDYSKYILTPSPAATPHINSAKAFGVHPGMPLLYKIATTGNRPMKFSADGLPAGAKLDAATGIISGKVNKRGTYNVVLKATNALGSDTRTLRLVVGDTIALTPPMGWNSWNCWGRSVSQEKVLSSARALLDKGLDQFGWTYINIDDGWQGRRAGKLNAVQPNSKFPDMKALADELHAAGLKLGVYSGPWLATYAGHAGTTTDTPSGTYPWIEEKWGNEYDAIATRKRAEYRYHGAYSWADVDARQWAEWGVDYLKFDWKPNDIYYMTEMSNALLQSGRDIVYSISNSAPFSDVGTIEKLVNCYRTTGDIRDNWKSMSSIGFEQQQMWSAFTGPGHWADADMLVVGMVGWGPKLHNTLLTPDEQYTHISLWALLSTPLLIGCDMAQLDDFTINLLCNYEVNDIAQDPLGMHGVVFHGDENHRVYLKILENGDIALGLFNLCTEPIDIELQPREFGLWSTPALVHDVWRQKDVTVVNPGDTFVTHVAPHGCALYRLSPGNTTEQVRGMLHYKKYNYQPPKLVK